MVQPPEPGRNQGGVVGGGGRCDSPQGGGDGHAPRHAHRSGCLGRATACYPGRRASELGCLIAALRTPERSAVAVQAPAAAYYGAADNSVPYMVHAWYMHGTWYMVHAWLWCRVCHAACAAWYTCGSTAWAASVAASLGCQASKLPLPAHRPSLVGKGPPASLRAALPYGSERRALAAWLPKRGCGDARVPAQRTSMPLRWPRACAPCHLYVTL